MTDDSASTLMEVESSVVEPRVKVLMERVHPEPSVMKARVKVLN